MINRMATAVDSGNNPQTTNKNTVLKGSSKHDKSCYSWYLENLAERMDTPTCLCITNVISTRNVFRQKKSNLYLLKPMEFVCVCACVCVYVCE